MTFSALPADDCKRSSDASLTAMARLLAVAGHDLKQPLQVALMSMAGAVRDGVDARTEQRIGTAMEALIRLECELDDIVVSSRTEHGPFPLRLKVQLGVVLDQVRSDWQLHADTCGIDIRFETPTFAADTDPRMLRTILRNLVGNAINYTSAGGHVTVACSRMADDIVIEVRDDGSPHHGWTACSKPSIEAGGRIGRRAPGWASKSCGRRRTSCSIASPCVR
jgi:signal transduction histidine kinase